MATQGGRKYRDGGPGLVLNQALVHFLYRVDSVCANSGNFGAVVSISTEKQHELIHIHRTILHGRRTTCLSGAGSELYHSSVYYLRLLYITDIIIMTPT